jgi:uncharacterized protein (DUF58 family)
MEGKAIAYALRWRVRGLMPGAHRGADAGQMGHFRQTVPFDRSPDPRRIDLRASLRDPFGNLYVRQFEQRTAAQVHVLIDTSASMAFGPTGDTASVRAVELSRLIAAAARDIHDAFGLAAGANDLRLQQAARRQAVDDTLVALASIIPASAQIQALIDAAVQLGRRRKLVFVISDFEFPLADAEKLFEALSAHDVVPVRLADRVLQTLPRFGLVELADLETGRKRLVWIRPALRERWQRERDEHRRALERLCARHGHRLLVIDGAINADALSEHLLER